MAESLRATYLTAGAAGMYCGSCMQDNTLARALMRRGVDVQLIPLYTPLQLDEPDSSAGRLFFGGVNVYLQQQFRLFRRLPRWMDRIFDWPRFVRWVSRRGIQTEARWLGAMTVSMLRGTDGDQAKEVRRLCDWLDRSAQPQIIQLSNLLIGGCIPELKRRLNVPLLVTLQGDDLFLNHLPEPYRQQALNEIGRIAPAVDAFVTHSRYYADTMAMMLGIDRARFRQIPLSIDVAGLANPDDNRSGDGRPNDTGPVDVGRSAATRDTGRDATGPPAPRRNILYLARLAPEKGLHLLVDAFIQLKREPAMADTHLHLAGWLGSDHRSYAQRQFDKLAGAGLQAHFTWHGGVDRSRKAALFREASVLAVPATYGEPKGLYVLEALAAGVPVVVPRIGALPELIADVGGGRIIAPEDAVALASELADLLQHEEERRRLGRAGQQSVRDRRHPDAAAQAMLDVWHELLISPTTPESPLENDG